MLTRRLAAAALGLALASGPGQAQEAEMIANLDRTPEARGSGSADWVRAGGRLYFHRYQPGDVGLWRTDGTAAGTQLVREFEPRFVSTSLRGGELPDGRLIFKANDPAFGWEPWVSDGTPAGTRLYADLCPGLCDSDPGGAGPFGSGGDSGFVRFGDEILFTAEADRSAGARLFATAGGAGGPRRVSELAVERWAAAGDAVFILTRTEFPGTWQLWSSAGDPGGEHFVQELDLDFVWRFLPFGSGVLLAARGPADELLVYFGDGEGLELIAGVEDVGFDFSEVAVGRDLGYLLFVDGAACRVLRTDGTPTGTFDLGVPGTRPCPATPRAVGDRLFFTRAGRELWTSDGTAEGTALVRDFPIGEDSSQLSRLTPWGSRLFFLLEGADGPGLWTSDGTPEGTELVRAFQEVDSNAKQLGALDDRLLFAAGEFDSGLEPWSSDGTAAGTRPLANLTADEGSSNPISFLRRSDDVIFQAQRSIYRADAQGVVELASTDVGRLFAQAGDRVFLLRMEDPLFGPSHILALDPATGDAEEVLVVPRAFEVEAVGDLLFLVSGTQISSGGIRTLEEVWVTDGTPAGTSTVFARGAAAEPFDLLAWRNEVYFSAFTPAAGRELWASDGTAARRAMDLDPGPESSGPDLLAATGDRLYLRANLDADARDLVLVDEDLTVAGAVPFAGVYPAISATVLDDRIVWLAPLHFAPWELWVSDGSPAGTSMLGVFDEAGPLVASGGQVFFPAASAEHGLELWATDGSPQGTRLVRDVEPGPESSDPSSLRDVDGTLVFAARTAASGNEPWASDGSPEGTRRLADVAPGPASSWPDHFSPQGDRILFAARGPDVGRELFALPRSSLTLPCVPGPETLCLNGGRFTAIARWRDFAGNTGAGRRVVLTSDTGYFWFFDASNVELVVKVLDGCAINGRFWVFAGGLTNVDVTLTVTDTVSGLVRTYGNPLGAPFQPIQDTSAFATCP